MSNAEWNVNLNADLTIDGLTIPKFTWAWFGANIAQGMIEGVGGFVVTRFLSGQFGGRSHEVLFREQLRAFAQLLRQALQQQTLTALNALLVATKMGVRDFMLAPQGRDRLHFATNDAQKLVASLAPFELAAYPSFMEAASLHLAILQERYKSDPDEKRIFLVAREDYKQHHESVRDKIKSSVLDWISSPLLALPMHSASALPNWTVTQRDVAGMKLRITRRQLHLAIAQTDRKSASSTPFGKEELREYREQMEKTPLFIELFREAQKNTTIPGDKVVNEWNKVSL